MLAAAESGRDAARWSVALALGLRQGEAHGLRWDAVDLERGTLTVREALQRQPGRGRALVAPKSAAGRRTIVSPAPLVSALRAHKAAQAAEGLVARVPQVADRDGWVALVLAVPAEECTACGAIWLDEQTARRLTAVFREMLASPVEVGMRRCDATGGAAA